MFKRRISVGCLLSGNLNLDFCSKDLCWTLRRINVWTFEKLICWMLLKKDFVNEED